MSRLRNPQPAIRNLYSPWPHRLAVLLVCATFPLIWVGGLVTSYSAGMAVPDWPTTFGYNLFLYPWRTWLLGPFDLFIEHGHRLFASLVGMISIAVFVVVWRSNQPPAVRALAAAVLIAVIFQGVLGGLRVTANEVQMAKIHGIFAAVFFGMTIALAVVTSRPWREAPRAKPDPSAAKLHRLAVFTTLLVLLQIAVGAHLRHLPADWEPAAFRAAVFFHLLLAAALLIHIGLTAARVFVHKRRVPGLLGPASALCLLAAVQVALGAGAWVVNYSWPAWTHSWSFTIGYTVQAGDYIQALTSTAHQASGSLILGVCVMLTLRALRMVRAGERRAAAAKLTGVPA